MEHSKEAPPPYGMAFAPPQPQPPTAQLNFGPKSQVCTCPHCHACVQTRIETVPTSNTHLCAFICCLVCFPFCFIPYCCESCHATKHYCPNCNTYLGLYDN